VDGPCGTPGLTISIQGQQTYSSDTIEEGTSTRILCNGIGVLHKLDHRGYKQYNKGSLYDT
jgi:hypothetical protein